jgi:2-oxoglutarate ferredoxin oxidoreductase subunit delta
MGKDKISQISINTERCKMCGVCIELCPRGVYVATQEGYPTPAHMEKCTECQLCELWCPDYAVEIEVQEDGA